MGIAEIKELHSWSRSMLWGKLWLKLGGSHHALKHFERAAHRANTPDEAAEANQMAGITNRKLGFYLRATELFQLAHTQCTSEKGRNKIKRDWALAVDLAGHHQRAAQLLKESVEFFLRENDFAEAGASMGFQARIADWRGEQELALSLFESGLMAIRRGNNPVYEMNHLSAWLRSYVASEVSAKDRRHYLVLAIETLHIPQALHALSTIP